MFYELLQTIKSALGIPLGFFSSWIILTGEAIAAKAEIRSQAPD